MIPWYPYFKFLLASTNEHGVHSPFVFQYLTRCLYQKPRRNRRKALDVMLKSIPYFGIKRVSLPNGYAEIRALLTAACPELEYGRPPYDLLYFANPVPTLLTPEQTEAVSWHNDSLCVLDHIHVSREATANWDRIKALENVRVTIDGFFCGLVFFRQEQAKQHFKIRI